MMTEKEARQWIVDNNARVFWLNATKTDLEPEGSPVMIQVQASTRIIARGSSLVEAVENCQGLITLEARKDSYRQKLANAGLIT